MKNKALIWFGSPHKVGYTAQMVNELANALSDDTEIFIYNCYEENPRPCIDCGFCKQQEGCSSSDLDGLYAALEESNILIIASPVYNMGFPSPLKAVIDRMQRYYNARFSLGKKPPIPAAKRAYLLLTAGSGEGVSFCIIHQQLEQMFTILNAKLKKTVLLSSTDENPALEQALEKIHDIAKDINQS